MGAAVEFNTLTELFAELCKKYSGTGREVYRYKLEGKYVGITYDELYSKVELFAHGLSSLGLKRGEKIAILSENRPEWPITDLASLAIGAIDVPIFPTLTAKQIEYILENGDVSFVVVSNTFQLNKILRIRGNVKTLRQVIIMNPKENPKDKSALDFSEVCELGRKGRDKHRDQFAQWLAEPKPEEIATIIYTSGTTGEPKGVLLTHGNFAANIKGALDQITITDEDSLLSFLPISHSFERMAGYYTALSAGACVSYAESIETVAQNLMEVRPTIVTTVPRLFERIHATILKNVESGSAAKKKIFYWALSVGRDYVAARKKGTVGPLLKSEYLLADKLVLSKVKERTGGRIRFFVSGGAALSRELGEFFEAVGIMIVEGYGMTECSPVISANRVDDYKFGTVGKPLRNVQVKIDADGEILTRGPHVMTGYYKDKESTRETIDRDGWLHTGDIGHFDTDGFIVITDRKKHLFVNSGGKNIAPQPIENLLQQSKFVDQVVLIGDKRRFNTALIVPDFEYLREFAKEHRLKYENDEELMNNEKILDAIKKDIDALQKDLAKYEQVRRFRLLSTPFTIENGLLTPTLKVKRKIVEQKYASLIESMYN
ncbi:MAG: long-chain fatty acid--CoA ligase [Bacteroidetes bacterium]|nr:long-chain fatty acid--CoA ligase [Bacteroidota bacterium]